MPPLTLLLSTPDDIPEKLLRLWNQTLFSTVQTSRSSVEAIPIERQIAAFHERILNDHQKTWYQLCREGFKLTDESYCDFIKRAAPALAGDRPLAISDPLLCFFAPLWAECIESVCVFYHSDPMDAAVRLQRKWRFPLSFGLALWEYHVVNALVHLQARPHVVFSATQFMEAPNAYFLDFSSRYMDLIGVRNQSAPDPPILRSEWKAGIAKPNPEAYLSEAQKSLRDALESGQTQRVFGTALSDPASDILFHYGNLRSGYDQIKQSLELAPKTDFDSESSVIEATQTKAGWSNLSWQDPVEIVVHVEGMAPMEFACDAESPVIEMLNKALCNKYEARPKLIYLLSDGPAGGAIYFASTDLRAIETKRGSVSHG